MQIFTDEAVPIQLSTNVELRKTADEEPDGQHASIKEFECGLQSFSAVENDEFNQSDNSDCSTLKIQGSTRLTEGNFKTFSTTFPH